MHGIKRRASLFNTQRIDHIYEDPHETYPKLNLHYGDLTDTSNRTRVIQEVEPDEVYNLGAQSHVAVSCPSVSVSSPATDLVRQSRTLNPGLAPNGTWSPTSRSGASSAASG